MTIHARVVRAAPVALVCAVLLGVGSAAADSSPSAGSSPAPSVAASGVSSVAPSGAGPVVPLLAFYYTWFDAGSWNRAKTDFPELGRYTSDDPAVMRQHIEWAKSAGIEGFIVSWKDTTTNNRRLRLLMSVARELDFKLAMIYQGLDFQRKPLPAATVAADFVTFRDSFAADPVFLRVDGKPLTIWSGTWEFTHDQVAQVTGPVRPSLLVLNTEKSVEGYQRIADVSDGDAYYWSSVNPETNTNYAGKLVAMSAAIHARGQYWIAPFAPGFDARLVGGEKVVERRDGRTLRVEYSAAMASAPDALGLISWNEWSENSYVEPSRKYGHTELQILRELRASAVPVPRSSADSSEPAPAAAAAAAGAGGVPNTSPWWSMGAVIGFVALLLGGGAFVRINLQRRARRRRGRRRAADEVPFARNKEDVHVRW
ncbi:MAG: endo-1,3-alpha-glucanase family glycosylhydrolase [Kineosporiaceae bacterium]